MSAYEYEPAPRSQRDLRSEEYDPNRCLDCEIVIDGLEVRCEACEAYRKKESGDE